MPASFYDPHSVGTYLLNGNWLSKISQTLYIHSKHKIQSSYHMSFIISVLETGIPPSVRKSMFVKVVFPQEFSTQEKYFHLSVIMF